MNILAIESSCDDSAVALLQVKGGQKYKLNQLVLTQAIHSKYGGVVPEVAAREHAATLPYLLSAFAKEVTGVTHGHKLAKLVDVVAVTKGPGLVTSLRVGFDTARVLAMAWRKPLIGINHIEGHIYANWLNSNGQLIPPVAPRGAKKFSFPAVVLVVSGGHSELLLMNGHGKYKLLGSTLDDASGEAFDKTAKLLGFGYPGGPQVSQAALNGNPQAIDFPRPLRHDGSFNFSFSGLKTAVRYFVEKNKEKLTEAKFVADVCASLEEAIVDVLVFKTIQAVLATKAKTVFLAGGVAANRRLREHLTERTAELSGVYYSDPPLQYCTDNAAMIAAAAYFHGQHGKFENLVKAEVDPAWELGR